jgi:hypothetical protein
LSLLLLLLLWLFSSFFRSFILHEIPSFRIWLIVEIFNIVNCLFVFNFLNVCSFYFFRGWEVLVSFCLGGVLFFILFICFCVGSCCTFITLLWETSMCIELWRFLLSLALALFSLNSEKNSRLHRAFYIFGNLLNVSIQRPQLDSTSIEMCTFMLQNRDQNFVSSFEVESWNSSSYNLSTFQ